MPATSNTAVNTIHPPSALWPGLLLSMGLAAVAYGLGQWVPLIGGPVFGIVLGVLVRNLVAPPLACQPGIRFAGKKILQWS
ncbi:MAG: putative sulfate exporter family transporter, partial [Lysobacter sp.]